VRPVALDAAEQNAFIDAGALNTPEAKHAGAVLLANLRLIKANAAGDPTQQLNEGARNWLTKTQAQINDAMTTAIAEPQLKALRAYKTAADIPNDVPEYNLPENVAKRLA